MRSLSDAFSLKNSSVNGVGESCAIGHVTGGFGFTAVDSMQQEQVANAAIDSVYDSSPNTMG